MTQLEPIRTLVVDDEPLAREGTRMLLEGDPEIAVVGEAGSGREALAQIVALRPDLVFLDVQMPEMDGFAVLSALAPGPLPAVIFVTAYEGHALRAFEVHALDYLLKPFDDERFADALRRAKAQLRLRALGQQPQLQAMLAAMSQDGEGGEVSEPVRVPASRLAIKDGSRVVFLRTDEIDWIEAADYYVQIHAGGKSYLHRETMMSLERRLDGEQFVRIHRSAIVNRRRIRELSSSRREATVVLEGGATLKVARSQRDKLAALRG